VDVQFNDINVYNIDTNSWWTPADIKGDAPTIRLGHSATLIDDNGTSKILIMFGGKDDTGDTVYQDVFLFDTVKHEWSKQTVRCQSRVELLSDLEFDRSTVHGCAAGCAHVPQRHARWQPPLCASRRSCCKPCC